MCANVGEGIWVLCVEVAVFERPPDGQCFLSCSKVTDGADSQKLRMNLGHVNGTAEFGSKHILNLPLLLQNL